MIYPAFRFLAHGQTSARDEFFHRFYVLFFRQAEFVPQFVVGGCSGLPKAAYQAGLAALQKSVLQFPVCRDTFRRKRAFFARGVGLAQSGNLLLRLLGRVNLQCGKVVQGVRRNPLGMRLAGSGLNTE